MQQTMPEKECFPGAVIAMQKFGDFLGFNPHCHILVTDGCFYGNKGMFRVAPPLELKKLETIFQHKVFRMLLKKCKITEEMVKMLSAWKHSGFNVFCGNRIFPTDDTAMRLWPLHHPRVVLAGTHEVLGTGRDSRLYGQRQKNKQEFSGIGMAGGYA